MAVLVCGGAGYIGSHCVYELIGKGQEVVVVDNFLTGHSDAVHEDAALYEGDIRDLNFLRRVIQKHSIDSVIHFAGCSLVGESMKQPLKYFDNNLFGTERVLRLMVENNIKKIVFSSSAAVYGEPHTVPIAETDRANPTNPYGETKLAIERMLQWADSAHGIKYASLRYFNVAGAHPSALIGERHNPETHLIPLVLQVPLGIRDRIVVFGEDYKTEDGTCIRDYIYIMDLIDAHLLALDYLKAGSRSDVFNLGNGTGFSVKQIIDASEKVTGHKIKKEIGQRRAGDPAVLVASSDKIKDVLGWQPKYVDIENIIQSAWNFHKTHGEEPVLLAAAR